MSIRVRAALATRWPELARYDQTIMLGAISTALTICETQAEHNAGQAEKQPGGKATREIPPSHEAVAAFLKELSSDLNPQDFLDFYASKGWLVGRVPMKDWRSAARRAHRTWGRPGGASSPSRPVLSEWERTQKRERRTRLVGELRDLIYPGGSAYAVFLTGEKLRRATDLREKIAALNQELDE